MSIPIFTFTTTKILSIFSMFLLIREGKPDRDECWKSLHDTEVAMNRINILVQTDTNLQEIWFGLRSKVWRFRM